MKIAAAMLVSALLALSPVRAQEVQFAPGYSELGYVLPAPGSYALPSLGTAADARVLDSSGELQSLHTLFDNKYVLLSFIYTTCTDVNGCPLTNLVLYQLKTRMQHDPVLAERLKLMSISFDPGNDTPAVMRLFGENFKYAGPAGDWQFLTTDSMASLQPILEDYDQAVKRIVDAEGNLVGVDAHIIRVFLIDPEREIRNIYSVDFLHQDMILNDFQNLLIAETDASGSAGAALLAASASKLSGPGDDKSGYEHSDYETRSKDLTQRQGDRFDLIKLATDPPLGLPPLPQSVSSTISAEKIALGRRLFFDRRLSLNNTISCAMCHVPEQGFTSNELSMAVGIEGRSVRRNSPTLYNVGYAQRLFHDGREDSLEQQVWAPLLADNEMANPSIGYVINKIEALSDYTGLFEAAFDNRKASMETIGAALAAYQRTLNSGNSAFDRWYFNGQQDAVSEQAKLGFELFTGKARCAACHLVNQDHALFTDHRLHNTGLGYQTSMGSGAETQKVQLAPGVFVDVKQSVIDAVGEPIPNDLGLYEITQDPADRWKYKTPTLRNIELTAPYMHNGELGTLMEVLEFYNRGGIENSLLDPLIRPLGLDKSELSALHAFLLTLTGDNTDVIVNDAFNAPVGDTL